MPHRTADFRQRSQLTELMDEPCSRDELRACLHDLAFTNRWTLAYRPQMFWLDSLADELLGLGEPVRILDVACGYGDSLRKVERWAAARGIAVELTGLDLNPDATAIAAEASPAASRIEWVTADVFAYAPTRPVHLVMSSLFTHHLAESDVVRFLQWMEVHAGIGWFINDLTRSPVPYHLFRLFASVTRLHHFVRHDGPVSIARAFSPEDWESMCAAAGIGCEDFRLMTFTPARLCVASVVSH